ncbi:MAG: ABC transporter permease subunit [Planctomycetaceae bacterium]
MDFEQTSYGVAAGFGSWLIIVAVFAAFCIVVGLGLSLLVAGLKGPGMVAEMLFRGVRDLVTISCRRVLAIATLTFRECVRRKTLWICAVFILLIMFGHWFLGGNVETATIGGDAADTAAAMAQQREVDSSAAKRYVVFVMTAIKWMLIPVAVILSCWGLPADIKERSLHTVVTKPTRRSEVVLGRIMGFSAVMTLMLLAMSLLGYVWIQRSVPERAQAQLIARVPVYGTLNFKDRNGVETDRGINVGDIWEFRSFVEGMTNSRAVYLFDLENAPLEDLETLRLEYNFEAFRTHKGVMGENVRFSFHLVNPATGVDVKFPRNSTPIFEFSPDPEKRVVEIPRKLNNRNADIRLTGVSDETAQEAPEEVDLFDAIVSNRRLRVEVACDDGGQYLGMARPDLFFRLPDRSFSVAYVKTMVGLGLMLILLVTLGTTASTFVKGPVATLLIGSYLLTGLLMRGLMDEQLTRYREDGKPLGGSLFESVHRILTQNNQMTALEDSTMTRVIQKVDEWVLVWVAAVRSIIPDFRIFDGTPYLANGFDVPWSVRTLPALAITIGFLVPCVILGTYCLQMRELEAK